MMTKKAFAIILTELDVFRKFIFGELGPASETLLNSLPSVDTFFFLSGTLVAYLTFIQLEKNKFNLIMFYVHRYIRCDC
jgi:peptidoglycan/LPS O-acetylase OafA/YrhL